MTENRSDNLCPYGQWCPTVGRIAQRELCACWNRSVALWLDPNRFDAYDVPNKKKHCQTQWHHIILTTMRLHKMIRSDHDMWLICIKSKSKRKILHTAATTNNLNLLTNAMNMDLQNILWPIGNFCTWINMPIVFFQNDSRKITRSDEETLKNIFPLNLTKYQKRWQSMNAGNAEAYRDEGIVNLIWSV